MAHYVPLVGVEKLSVPEWPVLPPAYPTKFSDHHLKSYILQEKDTYSREKHPFFGRLEAALLKPDKPLPTRRAASWNGVQVEFSSDEDPAMIVEAFNSQREMTAQQKKSLLLTLTKAMNSMNKVDGAATDTPGVCACGYKHWVNKVEYDFCAEFGPFIVGWNLADDLDERLAGLKGASALVKANLKRVMQLKTQQAKLLAASESGRLYKTECPLCSGDIITALTEPTISCTSCSVSFSSPFYKKCNKCSESVLSLDLPNKAKCPTCSARYIFLQCSTCASYNSTPYSSDKELACAKCTSLNPSPFAAEPWLEEPLSASPSSVSPSLLSSSSSSSSPSLSASLSSSSPAHLPKKKKTEESESEGSVSGGLPQREPQLFDSGDPPKIIKKILQFNAKQTPSARLDAEQEQLLLKTSDALLPPYSSLDDSQLKLFEKLISWPASFLFPALDLLRFVILHPRASEMFTLRFAKSKSNIVKILINVSSDKEADWKTQFVLLKCLCNFFSNYYTKNAVELLTSAADAVLSFIRQLLEKTKSDSKGFELILKAAASAVYNVLLTQEMYSSFSLSNNNKTTMFIVLTAGSYSTLFYDKPEHDVRSQIAYLLVLKMLPALTQLQSQVQSKTQDAATLKKLTTLRNISRTALFALGNALYRDPTCMEICKAYGLDEVLASFLSVLPPTEAEDELVAQLITLAKTVQTVD